VGRRDRLALLPGPVLLCELWIRELDGEPAHGRRSLVFDWESRIPFLAWTIVPYWSIDLFYGVSLIVCATRAELFTHAMRLLAAQVVSVACFLAFPLAFSFARPQADGLFGWMFDVLAGFDKPFNQAPSLHIALLIILWVLYARHLSGVARWILHFWFALIGVSVLTTYQHHFIDLPTGLWVVCFAYGSFQMKTPCFGERRSPVIAAHAPCDPLRARCRRARRSGTVGGGWTLWLLWVAGSLAIVSVNYAFIGEDGFQKQSDGKLGFGACWLLAPYLAGAWINSRAWTRNRKEAGVVVPGVLLGRLPTRAEREAAGVKAIVDVTAELPCDAGGIHYASVPMLDLVVPSQRQLERAARAIESAMKAGPVLVCCALGFSRSAMAVAAWLLSSRRAATVAEAVALVRASRPAIVLGAGHLQALEQFAVNR
jgi:protein-tyrosine phosphatase/membrane-associated phospholipid phosphatase